MRKALGTLLLAWSIALGPIGAGGCTETNLHEVQPPPPEPPDNRLRVKGDLCIQPETSVRFPVKVLFLLDQSASHQFTDPDRLRHKAVTNAIQELRDQPNVQIGIIGFATWTRMPDPENPFSADIGAFNNFKKTDPKKLGGATDYQGALATALRIIDQDIRQLDEADRPRTRYVVNFVTDGNPEPTCRQGCEDGRATCSDGMDNDGDGQVDGADDDCDVAQLDPAARCGGTDSNPQWCPGRCNSKQEVKKDSAQKYVDFEICGAYNQPRQIYQRVDQLMQLREIYNIADISVNSFLLFKPIEEIRQDPNTPNNVLQRFGYDRDEAEKLLEGIAERGNGTFRDVNVSGANADFLNFKIDSINVQHKLRSMFANNTNAVQTKGGLEPDSDGDGLYDAAEEREELDRLAVDTDGDSYGDFFEFRMASEGFDPNDDTRPATACRDFSSGGASDRDGDGLRDCEEKFLKTDPRNPDTDLDSIPDGLEFLHRTDPGSKDANADIDFDGVSNIEEIENGRIPFEPEQETDKPISYDITNLGLQTPEFSGENQDREKRCYDYDIRRIPLTTTPIPGQRGRNRIFIRSTQRPTQTAAIAGKMRTACVEAVYDEEGIKKPRDGVIDISSEALEKTRKRIREDLTELRTCPAVDTNSPRRQHIQRLMNECMGPKIQVGDQLLERERIVELTQRYMRSNFTPRIPNEYDELYRVGSNFNPDQHCYRPWEIDLFTSFLEKAQKTCSECLGGGSGADAGP